MGQSGIPQNGAQDVHREPTDMPDLRHTSPDPTPRWRRPLATTSAALAAAATLPARAHVKWFAPYIVEAPPQRIAETLADR